MKRIVSLLTVTVLFSGLPAFGQATEKKTTKPPAAAARPGITKEPAKKPAEAPAEAPEKVAGEGKAIPMYARVDAVDASGKSFTMKRKDGVEVKHVLTDTTAIMNGEAPAKLDDIKVGDWVSGQRRKKSDTEYEVVKITKFGAASARETKAKAEPKPEMKKD